MHIGVCLLYLTRYLDFTPNLDVVIIVVGVRSDPESPLFQSCGKIIHFMRITFVLCTCSHAAGTKYRLRHCLSY